MLKKINPILGPEVLFVLREMGHGDQIALVDGNYPASAHANKLIRADGLEKGIYPPKAKYKMVSSIKLFCRTTAPILSIKHQSLLTISTASLILPNRWMQKYIFMVPGLSPQCRVKLMMELIQFITILKKPAVIITLKQSRWTLKVFIKGLKMHLQL